MYRSLRGEKDEPPKVLRGGEDLEDLMDLVDRVQSKRERLKKIRREVREVDISNNVYSAGSSTKQSFRKYRDDPRYNIGRSSFSNNCNTRNRYCDEPTASTRTAFPPPQGGNSNVLDSNSNKLGENYSDPASAISALEIKRAHIHRIFEDITAVDPNPIDTKNSQIGGVEDQKNAEFDHEDFDCSNSENEIQFFDEDLNSEASYYDGDDDRYFPGRSKNSRGSIISEFFRQKCGIHWILYVGSTLAFLVILILSIIFAMDADEIEAEFENGIGSSPVSTSDPTSPSRIVPTPAPTAWSPICFTSKGELLDAVDHYLKDPTPVTALARKYGHPIGKWCVSQITDFSGLFSVESHDEYPHLLREFNEPLDDWDTSSATTMTSMFFGATSFNQDLSMWDVSRVENFQSMFMGCDAFDQNLSTWDVSSARRLGDMFASTKTFRGLGLETWDTSQVVDMAQMFKEARAFNGTIGGWNISSVTAMNGIFRSADSFNQDLHEWRFSPEMHRMETMFMSARSFNGRLDGWNVGETKTRDLHRIFFGASNFNKPVDDWDVSKVNNFEQTFASASSFAQHLASWDMTSATNLKSMFSGAISFDGNITTWAFPHAQNLESMFSGATSFNQPIGNWNVGRVNTMDSLFLDATSFNQDLSKWDTSNVQSMEGMFQGAETFNSSLSDWNVTNVVSMEAMFLSATRFNQDISRWNLASIQRMGGMFVGSTAFNQNLCEWIETLKLPNIPGLNDVQSTLQFLFQSTRLPAQRVNSLFDRSGCPDPENPVFELGEFLGPFCHDCQR